MDQDALAKFLLESMAEAERKTAHLPKPIAGIYVSREGQSVEVCLDTSKRTYSEWVEGEGADIGLLRDADTERLAGAHLPLYAKTLIIGGHFPTITIDLETGAVSIEEDEDAKRDAG